MLGSRLKRGERTRADRQSLRRRMAEKVGQSVLISPTEFKLEEHLSRNGYLAGETSFDYLDACHPFDNQFFIDHHFWDIPILACTCYCFRSFISCQTYSFSLLRPFQHFVQLPRKELSVSALHHS